MIRIDKITTSSHHILLLLERFMVIAGSGEFFLANPHIKKTNLKKIGMSL